MLILGSVQSSVQIWMFNIDTGEWTEKYRVTLKELGKHPQLDHLRTVLFPSNRSIFSLLTLQPGSDDGVIIWTPNLIFCYYLNSHNLVSLQCSNVLNGALDRRLTGIPFTRCLASLGFARHP
ncbi:hypothetical protein V6N12_036857 [Hibiscus sabdariffa]|uniref:F-box associated domain-containing protein n=1 Tax=Hibiscus sabdariffa TaxID=183260 RepID=A0ABR2BUW8_9ROSI